MGIMANVINWDELADAMENKLNVIINGTIKVDFGPIQTILERDLSEIQRLIKALADGKLKPGTSRIRGEGIHAPIVYGFSIPLIIPHGCVLTSLTYRQTPYSSQDQYSLVARTKTTEIRIFDGLYVKDTLQHKVIQPPFPPPPDSTLFVVGRCKDYPHGADVLVDYAYAQLEEV